MMRPHLKSYDASLALTAEIIISNRNTKDKIQSLKSIFELSKMLLRF